MDRAQAVAQRIHAQQLDRRTGARAATDAAVLDLGVQDTGRDGASWALVNRGVALTSAEQLESDDALALAWTLRSAPHYYRRSDLPDVLVATSPFSDRDAAKRVLGADKPLEEAGIPVRAGLAEVAGRLHDLVRQPMVKGEVSSRLTAALPDPYLKECVPCGARHVWEVPFRLGALYGGVELTPGTSPPVLRPVPDWPRRDWGPAADPLTAPERLQVIRGYLRLLGPASKKDVATFLDAPLTEVEAHWPEEAVPVTVEGRKAWQLPDAAAVSVPNDLVRLLGPFDLLLQGRDRELLVPDKARHRALWPTLGRPGAVLVGTDLVGSWRPRATRGRLTVRLELWTPVTPAIWGRIEEEAERLAAHRGATLSGIERG
ncbi:MAG: winged helix DNA-binding domain-containing protein [Friedmanniella sp.]